MDLRLSDAQPTAEERRAIDALLGAPASAWDGAERRVPRDGHVAVGGHAARARRHLLLPALHALQAAVGWISEGGLMYVCTRLSVPPAEAWGVATFYGLLATTPQVKVFRAPRLRAALGPVFATEFRRTRVRLGFADGSLAELCLDSGEIRSGRRAAAISEAEIELLAGSPVRLFELALDLAERVPLRLGHASKAERGYALARGLPARPVAGNDLAGLSADVAHAGPQYRVSAAIATGVSERRAVSS